MGGPRGVDRSRSTSAKYGGVSVSTSGDDIFARVNRIYAAVDATVEADLSLFPPNVINDAGFFGIFQEFSGGLNTHQIENLAHSLIHNIANFRDHLRRFARSQGADVESTSSILDDSSAVQLIKDLSNNDKHGYSSRKGDSRSARSPRLIEVSRGMRLSTGPDKGSRVSLTLGTAGPIVRSSGGGGANVVITGAIVAEDGERIGELSRIALEAVDACEIALSSVRSETIDQGCDDDA